MSQREADSKYFYQVYLPYCLKRQEDGSYQVQNRSYEPVGLFACKTNPDPQTLAAQAFIPELDSTLASKISYNGSADLNQIHLYESKSAPLGSADCMKNYLARLEILLKCKIKRVVKDAFRAA